MSTKFVLGVLTVAAVTAMFAGSAEAQVLADGEYTFVNDKGDKGWWRVLYVKIEKVREVDHPQGGKSGVYHVHTNVGWLTAKSSEAGAVVDEEGDDKGTTWILHKHSKGWCFVNSQNGANALSIVGLNPQGGGKASPKEFQLRRHNAGGNGMEDQVWQKFDGHVSVDALKAEGIIRQ